MYTYGPNAWTSREPVKQPEPRVIEKIVKVPYPVEKVVEKKVPYPVEKIVEKIVEVEVPVDRPVPYPVPVPVKRKCCHNPWDGYGPGPWGPRGNQYQYLSPLPPQRGW